MPYASPKGNVTTTRFNCRTSHLYPLRIVIPTLFIDYEQVQGVFSELDKSTLVKKLRKAREAKKVKTGRCESRKRLGFYKIARILNDEGWPTRTGTAWHGSHVSAILKRLKLAK